MPISRTIDPRDRFLRTRLATPVTLRDVESHLNVVFSVGVEACPERVDAHHIDASGVSVREVMITLRHFGLWRQEFAPKTLVVSSEELFSVARTVATLVCGWVRIGVFYDQDAASC
jgi:hypothetical protein